MKKSDVILIVAIIMISLGALFLLNFKKDESSKKWAEIVIEGKIYKKVLIENEEYKEKIEINTKYGYNLVYIHDGGVEITEADCHDKICIKTGFIDKKGKIIACLPHKLYVKILGEEDAVDQVSY